MKKSILIAACFIYSFCTSAQEASVNAQNKNEKESINLNIDKNASANLDPDFQKYVNKAKEQFAYNEGVLGDLKVMMMCEQKKASNKLKKKIISLTVENNELYATLETYLKYGIGNWRIFRREFNVDIAAVSGDILQLGKTFVDEPLMALEY